MHGAHGVLTRVLEPLTQAPDRNHYVGGNWVLWRSKCF